MRNIAVIFDMDGVIVDSEPVYKSLNQKLFQLLKLTVDDQVQLEFLGVTKKRKWQILKEKYQLQKSIEDLIKLQDSVFEQKLWDFNSLLFPEALPLLKKLKALGIPAALASSSEEKRVCAVLDQCGLRKYFTTVITGDDVVNGKPDPEIFLSAAKQLAIPPENCLVIEDSYNGLLAAKRANMYGIGIRHQQIKADLSNAERIVHSLAEIKLEEWFQVD